MSFDAMAFVTTLNAAWQKHDFDTLGHMFNQAAILQPPDLGPPITGRAPIVSTYREFSDNAVLLRFEEVDVNAYDFTATVVVHLEFEIEYTVDATHRVDSGLEVYVIEKASPAQIVWRQQTITHSRDIAAE